LFALDVLEIRDKWFKKKKELGLKEVDHPLW